MRLDTWEALARSRAAGDLALTAQAALISNLTRENGFYRTWNSNLEARAAEERSAWAAKVRMERLKFAGIGAGAGAVFVAVLAIIASSSRRW